ncbi:MAG TPA: hypothetical protein VIS76_09250 [Pseudomonadales bacterium]
MLPDFPDVHLERINVLEHADAMQSRGIRRYPALAHGDRILSVVFLTKRKIRRFLSAL